MNRQQYGIVKWVLSCGADPKVFAGMIRQPFNVVLKVQGTDNYDQFRSEPTDDYMANFMKGMGL